MHLEVSCAVRRLYRWLGVKGLRYFHSTCNIHFKTESKNFNSISCLLKKIHFFRKRDILKLLEITIFELD